MMDTLPRSINTGIIDFCQTISNHRPQFIKSSPSHDAQQFYCFANVDQKIERAGGSVAFGWAIWHLRGLYYEAEHHGVWQKRNGDLIDVSPQVNGYRKILFLPDSLAIYQVNEFKPNVFQPENENTESLEYVSAAKRHNQIRDSYRQLGFRSALLSPTDQRQVDHLQMVMRKILINLQR